MLGKVLKTEILLDNMVAFKAALKAGGDGQQAGSEAALRMAKQAEEMGFYEEDEDDAARSPLEKKKKKNKKDDDSDDDEGGGGPDADDEFDGAKTKKIAQRRCLPFTCDVDPYMQVVSAATSPLDIPLMVINTIVREQTNSVAKFIDEKMVCDPEEDVSVFTFSDEYEEWCVRMGLNIKNVTREVSALAERGIKLETRMVECLQGVRWRSADDPYTVFSDVDRSNMEKVACERDSKRPVFLLTHIKEGLGCSIQSHDGQNKVRFKGVLCILCLTHYVSPV
jgi:hypothetical protein